MAQSKTTTDHEIIRRWAEDRGGRPVTVKGTGNEDEPGVLRIDFPDYRGEERFQEISWEEFFKKFDKEGLVFLYQEETKSGKKSRFNKIISHETAKK